MEIILKYGSEDAGKTVHLEDQRLRDYIERFSKTLNLKPHHCSGGMISSAIDLEGHLGTDGKYYMLDFSRVLPPVKPSGGESGSIFYEMFRQEFHIQEIDSATNDLLGLTLSNFARELALQLEEELRMAGTLHNFRLTEELHRAGINVRYLGELVKRMGSRSKSGPFLVAHMCARVIKIQLRAVLRAKMAKLKYVIGEPYRLAATAFINMVFGNSEKSGNYWNSEITQALGKKFNLRTSNWKGFPADLKAYIWADDWKLYVFQEVIRMMGMECSASAMKLIKTYPQLWKQKSILSDTDLVDIGVRVKHLDIVNKAKGRLFSMRGEDRQREGFLPSAKQMFVNALASYEEALSGSPLDSDLLQSCAKSIVKITMVDYMISGSSIETLSATDVNMVRAKRYFIRAIQGDQGNPNCHLSYAKFLIMVREFGEAEDQFIEALTLDPCHLESLFDYREFLQLVRKDEESAAAFQKRYDRCAKRKLQRGATLTL